VEHQRVVAKLIVEISKGLNNCNCEVLPNIDYYVSEDTAVKPDVLVICKEIKDKITIPPEIIFEVVSPSSVKMDEHLKFELYEREKVKYYVLVYPSERKHIKIFGLIENKYQKVFETINENFSFKLENCLIDLDFSKLWN
jgi:Uma2 family endonuclease